MDDKILKQSIDRLDIRDKTLTILKENKINIIADLCKKSKNDLKKLDIVQIEINKIQVELQLLGLNLKGGL